MTRQSRNEPKMHSKLLRKGHTTIQIVSYAYNTGHFMLTTCTLVEQTKLFYTFGEFVPQSIAGEKKPNP